MKLLSHSLTSTVENWEMTSNLIPTLLGMWLIILTGIEIDLCDFYRIDFMMMS